MADVSVSPQATPGTVTVSVADGLQLVTLPGVLQVQPANPQQVSLRAPVLNALTGLAVVPSGGTALIGITGLPPNATLQTLAGWTLSMGGVNVPFFTLPNPNQIDAPVPFNIPIGPQMVHLASTHRATPSRKSPCKWMPRRLPFWPIAGPSGLPVQTSPVGIGDLVSMQVNSLFADPTVPQTASSLIVLVNGVSQTVSGFTALGTPGAYTVQFVVAPNTPTGLLDSVTVGMGTRQSSPYLLPVHN